MHPACSLPRDPVATMRSSAVQLRVTSNACPETTTYCITKAFLTGEGVRKTTIKTWWVTRRAHAPIRGEGRISVQCRCADARRVLPPHDTDQHLQLDRRKDRRKDAKSYQLDPWRRSDKLNQTNSNLGRWESWKPRLTGTGLGGDSKRCIIVRMRHGTRY